MKTQAYMLLILGSYIIGIVIGLLCRNNIVFLLLSIPITYVFWKGHKIQQRIDKVFKEFEEKMKKT